MLAGALAFRAGGFFPFESAALAVALLLLLVLRITVAGQPFAGWSRALTVCAGGLVLLAAWTLASAVLSDAPFRAMLEFDRVLGYALTVVVMGTFLRRDGDLHRLLGAFATVLCLTAVAALATRLFPATFPVEAGADSTRLAFPYTYWNAAGLAFAMAGVLLLHLTVTAQRPVLRILAAAGVPIVAVALYFTFSRGGLAVAAIGTVAYIALAHPRRLLSAAPAVAIPTAMAVLVAYGAEDLATTGYAAAVDEANDVALAVVLAALGAAVLRAAVVPLDRRIDGFPLAAGHRRNVLAAALTASIAAVLVVAVATDLPRALDDKRREFLDTGFIATTTDQRDRLTQAGGNGRVEGWQVAFDSFEREPVIGTGAGTYHLEWQQARDLPFNIVDAHSLYLEVLAELGIAGLVLLLVALLTPMAIAARRLLGAERHAHAAFLAAGSMLLIHAGIDWDWEMPAVFIWFAGAAGVVCARGEHDAGTSIGIGRTTRLVAGLACLVVAVTPATVALSQRDVQRAGSAFKQHDCAAAIDAALDAVRYLNVRPEPFEVIGYCDLRAGQTALAVEAMRAARRGTRAIGSTHTARQSRTRSTETIRDPWRPVALRLNPQEPLARELDAQLQSSDPKAWPRIAARANIPR